MWWDTSLVGDTVEFVLRYMANNTWLVLWNMNFIFPYIGNFIIPTDELIFFRGVGHPPTRYNRGFMDNSIPIYVYLKREHGVFNRWIFGYVRTLFSDKPIRMQPKWNGVPLFPIFSHEYPNRSPSRNQEISLNHTKHGLVSSWNKFFFSLFFEAW